MLSTFCLYFNNETNINPSMTIKIGKKTFVIPINELFIKRQQYYKLQNQGISHINPELDDISDKTDIIINVIMG